MNYIPPLKEIATETEYLFSHDWLTWDFTEQEEEEYLDRKEALIEKYGWTSVFEHWFAYLVSHCRTPRAVISFAHLFFWYGGQDYPIPDPHKFLAYLYSVVQFHPDPHDENDILDSLSCHILDKAGFREASLWHNPYYDPLKDPKIWDAAKKYWGYCPSKMEDMSGGNHHDAQ